jgi:hypothetical protein
MRKTHAVGLAILCVVVFVGAMVQEGKTKAGGVSYKNDVAPLLAKHCMPCHAEESANKSDLFLDSHALLMKGGKHGAAVVPGKPDESDLVLKLSAYPPFGDRMPLFPRRKLIMAPPVYLSKEEVGVIRKWIEEGAKGN